DGGTARGEYAVAMKQAQLILEEEEPNFHDPRACEDYFLRLYRNIETDSKKIQILRKAMDYPRVADVFRLIQEDAVAVLVCYQPKKALFEEIEAAASAGKMTRELWRKAQPLLVN